MTETIMFKSIIRIIFLNSKIEQFRIDYLLYNKRVRPTKNEPQQGISYLEREGRGRGGEREGGVGGRAGGSAGSHI